MQEKVNSIMKITILIISLFSTLFVFAQKETKKVLWNNIDNLPVQYATIKNNDNYTISNEEGVFEFNQTSDKIIIQSIAYQTLEIDYDFLKENDTIFMKPNVFELEEVVIKKDTRFNNMLKTILTDYALEAHKEKFFLRAIIKKNNEFHKIVDFSGYLEKNTLFDTKTKPMPKRNYIVQIDNIRKAGYENKIYEFELFSFETFLNRIASIYLSPKTYDLSSKRTNDDNYSKIIANPKDIKETKTEGYYIVDNDDSTFNEVYIRNKDDYSEFIEKKDIKSRTILFELKSNFKRNEKTNKHQLNLSVLKYHTEVISNAKKDYFEVTYIFYAKPVSNDMRLKNNVNLNRDMFELNGIYNSEFWKNNETLQLTKEMQDFITMVNSSNTKSDFRTKTNIK